MSSEEPFGISVDVSAGRVTCTLRERTLGVGSGASAREGPLAEERGEGRAWGSTRERPRGTGPRAIRLDSAELELIAVALPLDLAGGVAELKRHAAALTAASVSIDPGAVARAIAVRTEPPIQRLDLRPADEDPASLTIECDLEHPERGRTTLLGRVSLAPDTDDPLSVRVAIGDLLTFGFFQGAPAALIDGLIAAAASALESLPFGAPPIRRGFFSASIDPLAPALGELFPGAGWKIPSVAKVALHAVSLGADGRLRLDVARGGPDAARRGFGLAFGDLEVEAGRRRAYERLREHFDPGRATPALWDRLLLFGACQAESHESCAALIEDRLRASPSASAALLARAAIAEKAGRPLDAIRDLTHAASVLDGSGLRRAAGFALRAANRIAGGVDRELAERLERGARERIGALASAAVAPDAAPTVAPSAAPPVAPSRAPTTPPTARASAPAEPLTEAALRARFAAPDVFSPLGLLLMRTARELAAVLPPSLAADPSQRTPASDDPDLSALVGEARALTAVAFNAEVDPTAAPADLVTLEPGEPPLLIIPAALAASARSEGGRAEVRRKIARSAMLLRLGYAIAAGPGGLDDARTWLDLLLRIADVDAERKLPPDLVPAIGPLRERLGPSGLAMVEGLVEKHHTEGTSLESWLEAVTETAERFASSLS